MIRIAIGLGTNLGERRAHLEAGARALFEHARPGSFRLAALYETPPLGPPQPDYLNSAVSFETALTPEELLDVALAIEARAGRVRTVRWAPRTLDLDLLAGLQDDGTALIVASERLDIPHPELTHRAFALAPLLDVMPELSATYGPILSSLGGPPRRVAQASRRGKGYKGWTSSARVQ